MQRASLLDRNDVSFDSESQWPLWSPRSDTEQTSIKALLDNALDQEADRTRIECGGSSRTLRAGKTWAWPAPSEPIRPASVAEGARPSRSSRRECVTHDRVPC